MRWEAGLPAAADVPSPHGPRPRRSDDGRSRSRGAVLDRVRSGRGALRARVEHVQLARPLRRGGQGRLQGHRPLARRHRAPARDHHLERDEAGVRRFGSRVRPARVPTGLLPARGRPAARGVGRAARAALRRRRGLRRPPHQGGQHPRHAGGARPGGRGLRRALPGRGQQHGRQGGLRVHAVRRKRELARLRAGGGRGRRAEQRRPSRSTPGTWPSSASRRTT